MEDGLINKTKKELISEINQLKLALSNVSNTQKEHKNSSEVKLFTNLFFSIQKGKIVSVSKHLCLFFELNKSQLIGLNYTNFISPNQFLNLNASEFILAIKQALLINSEHNCLIKISIGERAFDACINIVVNSVGAKTKYNINIITIKPTLPFTSNLNINRTYYKYLINFVPDGVLIHKEGVVVCANMVAAHMLNYTTADELVGINLFEIILPEFIEAAKIRMKTLKSGLNIPSFTYKVFTKNKVEIVDIDTKSFPMIDFGDGEVFMVIRKKVNIDDYNSTVEKVNIMEYTNSLLQSEIVDRVRIENQLVSTKKYLASIINSSLDIIIATDLKGNIIEFNKAAQKAFGYELSEILGCSTEILYANKDVYNLVQRELSNSGYFSDEIVNRKSDGSTFTSFLSLSEMVGESSDFIGRVGISRDITLLKHQQESLINSENKFRQIFENTSDLLFSFNIEGSFIYFNNSFCDALGYDSDYLNRCNFFDLVHPNDIQKLIDTLHPIDIIPNASKLELTLLKSGSKYAVISGVINTVSEDRFQTFVCSFKNVSELKIAQEAVALSDERYKAVFNQDFLGIVITSIFGEIIQYNEKFIKLFNNGTTLTFGNKLSDLAAFNSNIYDVINSILNGLTNKSNSERSFVLESSNVLVCNESVELVSDSYGNPNFFLFIYEDVTDKKNVYDKNAKQSAKLNALLQSSSQLIFTVDKFFRLTSFNERFKSMYYQITFELPVLNNNLSANLEHFLSVNDAKHYRNLHKKALRGIPQHVEMKFSLQGFEDFWIETYIDPIVLPNGKIEEVSYINHNVTEKKIAQDKIATSLVEKEILLKEVHHRVKNNLQVISSILSLQGTYIKDEKVIETIGDIQNRIKSMSLIHENLYQNTDLSRLNLGNYIQQLTQNLIHSLQVYEGNIEIELEVDEIYLNLDYCIPCGLIINELVSNAFKHAFPNSRKGVVSIKIEEDKNHVVILLRDTGKGFASYIDFRNTDSLGLQLVTALVEQINGTIELISLSGKTEYVIKFYYNPI